MTSIRHSLSLTFTLVVATACGTSDSRGPSSDAGSGGSQAAGGGAEGGAAGANTGSGGTSSGSGGAAPGSGGTAPGSGGSVSAGGGAGGVNVADSGPAPLGPYPAAPYGIVVGATMTNLRLQGYVNATGAAFSNTLPWTLAYSLDDVRKSGKPYALVHVSDVNCGGCRNAGRQLGIDGTGILDAGGAVLEILSAKSGAATVQADLDAWITSYNLKVSSFIDASDAPTAALKMATIRETVFIVEVPSMKVVWAVHGDTSGVQPNSIIAAGQEMHRLLGK
jgi:hypothetical protein